MSKVVRRNRLHCRYEAHDPCPVNREAGEIPKFSRPLGLDFIITPEGRAVLIELQAGFGRKGLLELYPKSNRSYRKSRRTLGREYGSCFEVRAGMREICRDKYQTYKHFKVHQPKSFNYGQYTPKLERWLDSLTSGLILAKPPTGSCGKGIRVIDRHAYRRAQGAMRLPVPTLLQEFVEARPLLDDEGRPHVGCIRHIVLLVSDGFLVSVAHLPSYWRVSPVPKVWQPGRVTEPEQPDQPEKDEVIANISRGAFPLPVEEGDEALVEELTETICKELLATVLGLPECPMGETMRFPTDGKPISIASVTSAAARASG